MSAKAILDFLCSKIKDQDRIGVVVSTDLSSAFDTVDHNILTRKLHHYGVRYEPLNLLKSYLSIRTQYVKIQHKRSRITTSLNCSVIQGSKLSGLLYNVYTNEVPLVHKLLKDQDFMENVIKEEINN